MENTKKTTENTYYLAVDIGASSGRHILGWMEGGKLRLEEVYRFPNGAEKKNGKLVWNADSLLSNVIAGMRVCREIGKIPVCMGIDTWGVDYALLDSDGNRICDVTAYRDKRTEGMENVVFAGVSRRELYARTGIQNQVFNTIFQLMAHKTAAPEELKNARHFLMMPDYLNYCLTGKTAVEYTDASTTGLLDVRTRTWDRGLLRTLEYPAELFPDPVAPGTPLGRLTPAVAEAVGYDLTVLATTSHDTASAVLAMPYEGKDAAYLSSGTWSLMGVELTSPLTDEASDKATFTNEGGYGGRYRYLKNIMGLWMIQSIRRELGGKYSFPELSAMAREAEDVPYRVNVNDGAFLAPDSMLEAVKNAVGQPLTLSEALATVYHSLAEAYRDTMDELERCTGQRLTALYILGGGSQDTYLNELTARTTGRDVYTGVVEATATGNILCQMLSQGVFADIAAARQCVARSFSVQKTIVK